jgi:hypothetical protein
MHFPVIWRCLASPYMSPRRLEGGVSPRLASPYRFKSYASKYINQKLMTQKIQSSIFYLDV